MSLSIFSLSIGSTSYFAAFIPQPFALLPSAQHGLPPAPPRPERRLRIRIIEQTAPAGLAWPKRNPAPPSGEGHEIRIAVIRRRDAERSPAGTGASAANHLPRFRR